MNRHFLPSSGAILLSFFTSAVPAQVPMLPQQVVMGPGYANEIYYQFTTFETYATPRNAWDLSFRTDPGSGSVLINDGSNAILWAYPYSDISGWASVDTNDLYTWPPLYNDPDDWENGAFNRNSAGYPDYGWGIFNPATGIITGDSIFIMQLVDGTFKKVWIVEKNTAGNTWLIRYANLDGSDSQEVTVDCDDYTGKYMVGLNMQINLPVNYEPVKESWDILFTKYMAMHPSGVPVVVTGVLSNPAIVAKKFYPVDPDFNDWELEPWDSGRSTVGWDWKWFDLASMTYYIRDSMVFYVKEQAGNVYRLKFTGFEGTSTGVIDFGIAIVQGVGIPDAGQVAGNVRLWPNPATDVINITVTGKDAEQGSISLSLSDMTGRKVMTRLLLPGETRAVWDISALEPGTYTVVITPGISRISGKIIKL